MTANPFIGEPRAGLDESRAVLVERLSDIRDARDRLVTAERAAGPGLDRALAELDDRLADVAAHINHRLAQVTEALAQEPPQGRAA